MNLDINILYFAYGSNMDLDHLAELGVEVLSSEQATLPDYILKINVPHDTNNKLGYANVEKQKGHKVEGLLLKLPKEKLELLDDYEGYPDLYTKEEIEVKNSEGKEKLAIIYLGNKDLTTKHDLKLPKYQKEKMQNALQNLSPEYSSLLQRKLEL